MNFEELIQNAIFTSDPQQQKNAEVQLIQIRDTQTQEFFIQLTKILTNDAAGAQLRQFCGTLLKSSARQIHQQQNKFLWLVVNEESRNNIKEALTYVLVGAEPLSSKASSDAISTILTIEEPLDLWPDLIKKLGGNSNHQNESIKKASIMTLGYICEKFKALQITMKPEKQEAVLVGICHGMAKDNQNNELRCISINALRDALYFLEDYMKDQKVRDFVLNLLVQNFQVQEIDIQKACYQCLIEYCKVQYDTLDYLIQGFFTICKDGFVSQTEDIVISAIEVWNTIAQEYKDRLDYNENLKKQATQKQPLKAVNHIQPIFEPLIQFLLQLLLKFSADKDETTSPIQDASERCLCSIAEITGDAIINTFTAFISNTHDKPEWYFKQASCIAFSSMLEGPNQDNLRNLISSAMSKFVVLLQDEHLKVKDSASKLLNRIAELYPECYYQSNSISQDLVVILNAMQGPAKISRNICWIICYLSEHLSSFTQSVIMQSVSDIIKALIQNAVRQDLDNQNLSVIDISFMGIMNILYSSRNIKTTKEYLETSMTLFSMIDRIPDFKRPTIKNGLLATIHSALLCLQQDFQDSQLAQNIYALVIQHFQSLSNVDSSGLYVISALATCLKGHFVKILDDAWKYIEFALQKPNEKELFSATIGTIADIARACQDQFNSKINIIEVLMQSLEKQDFDKDLKLQIFLCIGDIILVCKEKCCVFIPKLMEIYMYAFTACAALLYNDKNDQEYIEYAEQLQEHLVESYTCMIHGINDSSVNNDMIQYFPHLFKFLEQTTNRNLHPQIEYLKNALQLVVDIANFYGQNVKAYVTQTFVQDLIVNLKTYSKTQETQQLISYSEQVLSNTFKL